jgi:pimeloyl-ACP methyl ester carboxylesterase
MPKKKSIPQKDGFAYTNGVKLHYVSQGKGPLALMLHGFPEFWYSWRYQLPFLAQKFQAVAPDLRGYNTSDKPVGVSSYYMDELLNDVIGLIKYFGAEKAVIISHDWGGVIAWNLAAFHPEVVEKLVVMNAPHPQAYFREIRRSFKQLKSSWYVFMFQLPLVAEWWISKNDYETLENMYRGMALREDTFSDEDIRLFKEAIGQPGCLTAAVNYYRGLFRDPSGKKRGKNYPKISVPTQIIWAENDLALTNELTVDLDEYFTGGLEVRYVPNCSHWVQQEQPEQVNEYLKEFLF